MWWHRTIAVNCGAATVARYRAGIALLALALGTAAGAQERSLETCADGEPTTAEGLPDGDADGVPDSVDNCLQVANADQRDTDSDDIGNACDADLDNDGVVNAKDLGLLKAVFFSTEPDLHADLDGDGAVALEDLAILRASFFQAPGPVGACIADASACAGPVDFEFDDLGQVAQANLFVFRTNDAATIYHARRLLSGASECNRALSGRTYLGARPWNPDWGFHIDGTISFHGNSIQALVSCDQQADFIQTNLAQWCGNDAESAACQFWCPWRSQLTREITSQP